MTKFGRMNAQPPAHAPRSPANIGDPDANLDSQRPRERLTDRDAFAHLLLGQPLPLPDQFPLHLAHESDGTAEADRPKAEVVADEFSNGTRRTDFSGSIIDLRSNFTECNP